MAKAELILGLLCVFNNFWTTVSSGTSSPPTNQSWINTPVPAYYVLILGAVLILLLLSFIIYLLCMQRRPVGKGNITDEAKESTKKVSAPSESNVHAVNLTLNGNVTRQDKNTPEPEIVDNNETREQIVDVVVEPSGVNRNEGGKSEQNQVWKKREEQQHQDDSSGDQTKPKPEPVYAQVDKSNKEKQTNPNTVVYADLLAMECRDDAYNLESRQSTEYAEVTRLAQSPREMTPLED